MLLVELEVPGIARITEVPTPDLKRRPGIPGEDNGAPTSSLGHDPIRMVWIPGPDRHGNRRRGRPLARRQELGPVDGERAPAHDHVGVGHEVFKADLEEKFLQAWADAGGAFAGRSQRSHPFGARPVGALGEPDATGLASEVTAVGLHGGSQLKAQTLLTAEEGKVAVGRRARQKFKVPLRLKGSEGAEEVSPESVEEVLDFGEPLLPEVRESRERILVMPEKLLAILPTGPESLLEKEPELPLKGGVGQLLSQNGGDTYSPLGTHPLSHEPLRRIKKGDVALGGSLVEPIRPMRPPTMIEDKREVGVEDQRECATRFRFMPTHGMSPSS
jgi:hypothetical protein